MGPEHLSISEYFLWAWVVSLLAEEVIEFASQEGAGKFFQLRYKVFKVAQCVCGPHRERKKDCAKHANTAKNCAHRCLKKTFFGDPCCFGTAKIVHNMNGSCYGCAALMRSFFAMSGNFRSYNAGNLPKISSRVKKRCLI